MLAKGAVVCALDGWGSYMVKTEFVFVEFNSRFLRKCVTEGKMLAKGAVVCALDGWGSYMVKTEFVFVEFHSRFLRKCVTEGKMLAKGANNGTLATHVLIMEPHLRATLPDA